MTLIALGVVLLALGIANYYHFMRQLRGEGADFVALGLLPSSTKFPTSLTLVTAFLLMLVGLFAFLGIAIRAWPFG